MKNKNSTKSLLTERINSNAYLLYRCAKNSLENSAADALSPEALSIARTQLYCDMLKWMPFRNRALYDEKNALEMITNADESSAAAAMKYRKERVFYYDPVVFAETIEYAAGSFSKSKGVSFTTWFNYLYVQKLPLKISETTAIKEGTFRGKFSRTEYKTLQSIADYMNKNKLAFNDLAEEVYDKLSAELGRSKESIRSLLDLRMRQLSVKSIDSPISAANDATLADTLEDPSSEALLTDFDKLQEIQQLLEFASTPDFKEYNRLFLNNGLLHPLKDKLSSEELKHCFSPGEQYEALKKFEDILVNKIFENPYIEFCLDNPLKPYTIDHLYECKSVYPFISETIVKYKDTTASNVSQKRQKFRRLIHEVMAMLH